MLVTKAKINNRMFNEITKSESTTTIGSLLLEAGKITEGDAERIVALQKHNNIRFGDAAKALGLINDEDIQKALSHQFDFPFLVESEEHFSQELIAAYQPFSKQVCALQSMREQLMLRWFSDAHKTLALVSPSRSEGRSFIAANLAIVFSQLGERTLLIDADLRQPKQHILFKLQGSYGLSDVLAGRADMTVVTQVPAFSNLSILPAGTVLPNPAEWISRRFKSCLQQLQKQFDVILIDTASADQGMDAQIISSLSGGALLVARKDKTQLNSLQLLKEALQDTGSQCLGSVLNEF
jgi:chain length determinant protein tyrosine kinase EpsG